MRILDIRLRFLLMFFTVCCWVFAQAGPADRIVPHYGREKYRLLKNGDTIYLYLSGDPRPLSLKQTIVPNVYMSLESGQSKLTFTEMTSAEPERDGLFVTNDGLAESYAALSTPSGPSGPAVNHPRDKVSSGENYPAEQNPSIPSRPRNMVSLDGLWKANWNDLFSHGTSYVRVSQSDTTLTVVERTEGVSNYNQPILQGIYRGESTFGLQGPPSNPSLRMTIRVEHPDLMIWSNGFRFVRVTMPPINDFACDTNNSHHVEDPGAMNRLKVAAEKRDLDAMFCWAFVSAKYDNPDAEYVTAALLRRGLGVQRDSRQAFHWMSEAATRGVIDAHAELAEMYEAGEGTARDPELAALARARVRERTAGLRRPGLEAYLGYTFHLLDLGDAVNDVLGK